MLKLLKSDFFTNSSKLMSGTIVAQAIAFFSTIAFTRFFDVSIFGIASLYASLNSTLSIFVTGRYDIAIVLPKEQREAYGLFSIASFLSITISIVLLLLIILVKFFQPDIIKSLNLGNWIYTIPLSVSLAGLIQSFSFWSSRAKKYKTLAVSKIYFASLSLLLPIVFLYLKIGVNQIVLGFIAAQCFTLLYFFSKYLEKLELVEIFKIKNYTYLLSVGKKYKEFPMVNSLSSLIDQLSISVPLFGIEIYFSVTDVAHYSLMQRTLAIPVSLVLVSVSQVLYQQLSEYENEGKNIYNLILTILKWLIVIGIIPYALIILFGPEIYTIVFGTKWINAGHYASYYAIAGFISFLATPLSTTLLVKKKMFVLAAWQLSSLITSCVALAIAKHYENFEFFIQINTVFNVFNYLLYLYLILKYSKIDKMPNIK